MYVLMTSPFFKVLAQLQPLLRSRQQLGYLRYVRRKQLQPVDKLGAWLAKMGMAYWLVACSMVVNIRLITTALSTANG